MSLDFFTLNNENKVTSGIGSIKEVGEVRDDSIRFSDVLNGQGLLVGALVKLEQQRSDFLVEFESFAISTYQQEIKTYRGSRRCCW